MDVSSKANIADLQRYVTQLKSELEAERTRHKQIRREHLAEIRRMKDEFELEKQGSINHLRDKINNGKKKEIEQIREKLQKEKDRELRQVLRYKDEEMKTLQAKLTTEKDEVLRVAAHQRPNQSKRNSFSLENEQIQKLKQEVKVLKEKNQSLEDDLVNKSSAEDAKVEEIKRLKKEHEKELKRVVKETKQSTLKDLRHLHSLEKALETKGIEISKNETLVKSLEGLRKELDDKLNSLRQASAATTPRRLSLSSAISQTDDTTPVLIDINIENKIEQEEQALLVVTALLDDLHNVDQYTSPDEVKKSEDRDLLQQRKISDLNAHIKALESKITILKSENEALQHKKDEEQSSEDKIKKLKKRNSELAAIARRLDDKTKQLHTETSPKKSPTKKNAEDKGTNSHEIEQLKKVFARQRAKDLAEHARSSLAKDKELESLRKKCQDLSDQLAKHTAAAAENSDKYEDRDELQKIMRQAAMERLRLERQVAINSVSSSSQVQNEEVSPQTLQEEIKNLHEKLKERDKLEKEIQAKRSECEHLIAQKELQNQNLNKLENDLQLVSEEKTQLAVENSDLHQQIIQIEKVNDECKLLRDKLSTAEQESVSAKSDVNTLQDKVANLEALLFHYRESADKRKQLEDEHQEALTELHQKQEEVQHLHKVQDDIKKEHEDTIESLQVKLRELERKCELQAIKHDELSLELTSLKKQSKNASTSSIEIQTDQDAASKLDSALLPRMSPKRRQRDVDSVWDINSIHSDRSLRPSDSTIGTIKSTDTGFVEGDDEKDEVFEETLEIKAIAKKIRALSMSDDEDDDILSPEKEKKDKILKSKLSLGDKSVIPPVLLNKGHVKIFVAKYSYDPVSYSPNENPEAELSLNAGDYVMVSGDVDEDGFYEGELMDGRKGLVPSNFVAEVPDEDLDDFHATLALGGKSDETSSIGSSFQHDLDFNSSDESEKMATELPEDMQRVRRLSEHLSDLEDIEEVDEDNIQTDRSSDINSTGEGGSLKRTKGQKNIPCPRKLTLDRQLTNSILIGWAPPDVANPGDIQAYHIYVDGQFKTSVKGTERTRALVEGVTSTKSHRVCVRTVLARGQSKDQECTITIGKESTFAPSNMKSSNITATSAHISWWPGNSNYQHVIYLNDKEYRILRPGVYKIVLTDLSPNAQYKVTVRAKSLKAPFDEEKNLKKMEFMSSAVEFHTLPGGLPDAPLDLQVEAGPQDGMLLATWLPVTINAVGTSNGALVTGYAVYVDGVKMKEVNSPTADHVILDASHLRFQIPHACALTVRTLAGNKESKDSVPSKLPHADTTPTSVKKNSVPTTGLINGSTDVNEEPWYDVKLVRTSSPHRFTALNRAKIDQPANPWGELDPYKAYQMGTFFDSIHWNPEIKPQFPDEMVDSSHSELSDIAEVEEETDMSDLDKRRIDLDKTPVALFAEPPIKVIDGPRIISKSPIQQVTEVPLSYRPDKLPTKLTADNKTSLGIRTSPHGAESEENTPVITPPIHMTVPHIEITKDSSLSNDGNTDDDTDNHSYYSNSPASPRSPRSPKSPEYTAYDYSQRGLEKVQHGAKKTDFENNNKQEKRVPHSPKNVEKTSSSPASPRSRGGSARSRNSRPNSARDESIIELESNDMISPKKIRDDIPESELIDYEDDGTESLAEIDIEYDESNSRLYIALFDYDPISMSPNPETADEELPFKEGQLIKIYGDKDADGFYQGEANGRLGYVPYNMVSEVQLDDPELAKQLLNDSDFSKASSALSHDHIQHVNGQSGSNHRYTSQSPRHSKEHSPRSQRSSREHSTRRSPNRHTDDPIRKMIALYDYDPQELSPNVDSEVELAFRTGDIVYVYGDMDEDGFYYGEMNGIQGLVPSNFLQEVPVDEEELFALRSSDSRPQSEGSKSGDKSQESSAVEESPKSETRSLEPADQVKNEKNNPPSPISTPPLVDDDRKRDKKGFKFNIFKKFSR